MKPQEITVNVNVEIPDETAERCLRVLNMWLEDNQDKRIIAEDRRTEHGVRTSFRIERREE